MTSIGAIKVYTKIPDTEKYDEHLVFAADSMGSLIYQGKKMDHYQKLFRIGDNLLMATGSGSVMLGAVHELLKNKFSSVYELAQTLSELVLQSQLSEDELTNFILGGYTAEGLKICYIDAKQVEKNHKRRGWKLYTIPEHFCFDGCGKPFVENYMQGLQDAGKITRSNDLADALSVAYDFSKKAARSIGVNDKLQFGIISKDGISRLYHPDIRMHHYQLFLNYLSEITNIDFPTIPENIHQSRINNIGWKIDAMAKNLKNIVRKIFYALESDLSDYSEEKHNYTRFSEYFSDDIIPLEKLIEIKLSKLKSKQNIIKGTKALVNRGIDSLLEYQDDFDKRMAQSRKIVLSYKPKP